MGKSIPVQLGDEIFKTKGKLRARVQNLIEKYPLMAFLDSDDKEFCLSLFKYHPDYLRKIGSGIIAVQVRIDESHCTRHFHLHRNDESDEEISWTKCLASIK